MKMPIDNSNKNPINDFQNVIYKKTFVNHKIKPSIINNKIDPPKTKRLSLIELFLLFRLYIELKNRNIPTKVPITKTCKIKNSNIHNNG